MKQEGAIKGLVRDADNLPIADVSIVIVTGPSHQDIAALTGSDGTFCIGSLQPGRYVIKAYGRNVESDTFPVQVLARQAAAVEIWLETDIVNEINSDIDGGCG